MCMRKEVFTTANGHIQGAGRWSDLVQGEQTGDTTCRPGDDVELSVLFNQRFHLFHQCLCSPKKRVVFPQYTEMCEEIDQRTQPAKGANPLRRIEGPALLHLLLKGH